MWWSWGQDPTDPHRSSADARDLELHPRVRDLLLALHELQLAPTESTQVVQPSELPMLKAELPVFDPADADKDGKVSPKEAKAHEKKKAAEADKISTGSVKP